SADRHVQAADVHAHLSTVPSADHPQDPAVPLQLADRAPLPGASSCPSSPARRRAMELPRAGRVRARGRSRGSLSGGASTSGLRVAEERGMAPPSTASPPPCTGGEERRRDPAASGRRSSALHPVELAHDLRSVAVMLDPRPPRLLLSPCGVQDPWRRRWGSRSCCLVHPSSHHGVVEEVDAALPGSDWLCSSNWIGVKHKHRGGGHIGSMKGRTHSTPGPCASASS
ncbi:unnamed protein product, partial [Urochloa humidicola]